VLQDSLGKFNGKADEGFLVGYHVSSKAFRVFNSRTRIVQETLHINFLENQRNVVGSRPTWLFDIDILTQSMNYQPVVAGNQPNSSAGIQEHFDADKAGEENVQQYVLFPLWSTGSKDPQNTDADVTFEVKEPESEVHVSPSSSDKTKKHDDKTKREAKGKITVVRPNSTNNTNTFSATGHSNNIVSSNFKLGEKSSYVASSQYPDDPDMPALEDITYSDDEEDVGAEADFSNLETNITVNPIPTTRVHKDHLVTQIIGDLSSAPQTRKEPKRVHQALKDPSWIEAMQEELLQFKMQKVWVLVDLPKGKRAIGSTWEKGIDYEEVFAPVARIEAIRLFLAYASFMGFMVYQIDVKSAFLYGTIEEEVYVCQPLGFKAPNYPDKGKIDQTLFIKKQKSDILLVQVYVDDIIFGSTNKDLCKTFEKLMKDKFQMSSMGELTFFLGLQVKQKQDRIFISQDKYVAKILRKFGLTDKKSSSTPIDTEKPLLKDPDGEDVYVHTYRLMIGSLMYLTLSRPDIMFSVCACAHFQVTPKASHLLVVKRIFRYLKGKPHLGLWYPKDLPFNLVAYSNSDYARQSWSSVSLKKTNDAVRLQALIDRRKVIITEDSVRQALRLDDADSIDCLPNEEIFAELARMRYEKPSTKLTFYKAFFSTQWKFLIHTILQCMSAKRTAWNEFSSFMASAVICLATEDEDVANEISAKPTPPSPTPATTPPPQQELIPSPSQLLETCVTLTKKVGTLEQDKIAQAIEITKLKQRVRRLEKKRKSKTSGFKRLRKVSTAQRVESSADTVMDDQEDAEPVMVEEVLEMVTAAKLMTEVVTTATTTITAAPVPKASAPRRRRGVIIHDPKEAATASLSMTYTDIRPIFEKHFNSIWAFLEKGEKEIEEEDGKRKSENHEQKAAKKQKIDEETLVIDYQIHTEHNKPYYKIIRAYGTHQLFLSFISLLRIFDREDLEMLWKIVQERFESLQPKNFSNDFMLNALKTMFEKPNVKDDPAG
nr:hypothetical protein [Tanacetum cinerariifolium]